MHVKAWKILWFTFHLFVDYKVARVMKLDNGWLNWQMDTLCHQPGFNFKIRNFINLLVLALSIK